MRTTLYIDDQLLDEAMRASGSTTKTRAVELGLRALVQREASRRLKAMFGADRAAPMPDRRQPAEPEP